MTAILTTSTLPPTARIQRAALGFLAAASFIATSPSVFAGTKEIAALNAILPPPATIQTATADQLATAVVSFKTTNPDKLNPGVIAGEALKGSTQADTGAKVGAAVLLAGFPVTYGTKSLTQNDYMSAAIKTTGAGKNASVAQVPSFAASLFTTTPASDQRALAILVKGTKSAAGAVLQGGASLLATDALKIVYAQQALSEPKLSSVIQDTAKGVAVTVADPVPYTNALVSNTANSKNLLKIIPGIVGGQPTNAGVITNAAFTNPTYAPQGYDSPIVKGASTLAKSIGLAADVEQIQKVGEVIAGQIPIITTPPGKKAGPNIKISKAASIAATLAKAIASKPIGSLIGGKGTDPLLQAASPLLVKNSERADEIGELAAYFINAIFTSAELTSSKDPGKIISGILKSVITGGKLADKTFKYTKEDISAYYGLMATYVSGSVALTVSSLPAGSLKTSITTALTKAGFAKSLAGGSVSATANIEAAINLGLTGATGGRFEAGNIALGSPGSGTSLTDPETNSRNF